MADGEITQRDNPLTRHLNAISALNEQYGSRAEGGAGVPIVREETAGGVSLPPATEVTAAEQAELEAAWAAEQATRNLQPQILARPEKRPEPIQSWPKQAELTDFLYFDLEAATLTGNNGDIFEMTPDMVKSLKLFGFQIARESIAKKLIGLANTLGINLQAEVQGETAVREVPSVEEGK